MIVSKALKYITLQTRNLILPAEPAKIHSKELGKGSKGQEHSLSSLAYFTSLS